MINYNPIVIFVCTMIPLVFGFIWYNDKAFGKAWAKESNIDPNNADKSKMMKIFGITIVLSFLYTMALHFIVIHQLHYQSMLMDEVGFMDGKGEAFEGFIYNMNKYGQNFRSFKHGVLHGFVTSLAMVLPIIGINGLFEQKSWKYIFINTGYWAICSAIMGGIICQFT